MAEYDLRPQELALEVAAGNVDLGLEAELLAEPDRRAVAVANADALARSALERVDANRVARRELLELLGDAPRPWIGVSLASPAIVDALDEAARAIDAGADLVRVEVPPSRELAERLAGPGSAVEGWRAAPTSRGGLAAHEPHGQPIPTGAQRALSVLRRFVDEAGARRRGYVRLMTDARPLAAPDQAVVAAFERIDMVVADPIREMISGRVDPDRALADHVFAHRLLCRAGARVLVPAGPLLVAPDLERGLPSDPATRAGRALAMQLLAVALAQRDGLPPGSIVVGAFPDWLVDEPGAPLRAAAEVALRRALLPDHPLAFVEPAPEDDPAGAWHALVAALLPDAGDVDLVLREPAGTPGPCHRPHPRSRHRRHGAARGSLGTRAVGSGRGACRPRGRGRAGHAGGAGRSRLGGRRGPAPRGGYDRPGCRGGRRADRGVRRPGRGRGHNRLRSVRVSVGRRRSAGRQTRVSSSGSSSATRRSQVGQCHAAWSGVPHSSWRSGSPTPPRRAPQPARRWRAPASSRPSIVSAYSMRSGRRRVGRRDQDPGALEAPQPVREDVGGDPGHGLGDLVEPQGGGEQRLHQEQAPAVADAVERGAEGARRQRGRRDRRDGSSPPMVGEGLAGCRIR